VFLTGAPSSEDLSLTSATGWSCSGIERAFRHVVCNCRMCPLLAPTHTAEAQKRGLEGWWRRAWARRQTCLGPDVSAE